MVLFLFCDYNGGCCIMLLLLVFGWLWFPSIGLGAGSLGVVGFY